MASVSDLPRSLLEGFVDRLRAEEPGALALLVTGSYAAGDAAPDSDLDLTLLTEEEPAVRDRTWIEQTAEGPLHVSIGARRLEEWLERRHQPASWSFGFPVEAPARFAWTAKESVRKKLGDPPTIRRPAGRSELEDFFELAMKLRRAVSTRDWIGARWWARVLADLAPALLVPLNPERRVSDQRTALEAALALPNVPDGWREHLSVCFGLEPAANAEVADHGLRLARSVLAFLRERRPDVDQPDLAVHLAAGTLERMLEGGY